MQYGKLKGTEYEDPETGDKVRDDSCRNLEERAERLDVFGRTKTFRDTPECKIMVWDYTCLWWGSQNSVYTNNCADKKLRTIEGEIIEAALQPCLSYCTQVANTCANRPEWIRLCALSGIQCANANTAGGQAAPEPCTSGPSLESGSVGCDYYELVSFYSSAEGIFVMGKSYLALAFSGVLVVALAIT